MEEYKLNNQALNEFKTSDLKPNSHKYKETQKTSAEASGKKIEKIIKGKAKTKKKSELHKFTDVFISEDAANVKSYIIMDVLIPAAKKAISDIVRDGIDMILYGSSGKRGDRYSGNRPSYASYAKSSSDRYREESRARSRSSFDDIIFETRDGAEDVLMSMDGLLERYGVVTVADMYDMAELTQPYTSNRYGWTSLRSAEIVRCGRDGYMIKMPRPAPID